jgi:hypothetical protein
MLVSARLWVLSWLLAATALGQHPVTVSAPAPQAAPMKPMVLRAGEISVIDLVATVGQVGKHNILCTEQQAAGAKPIALTQPVALEPATCEDLLCSLLYTRGLALVPVQSERGGFEVIALAGSRGQEVMGSAPTRTPEEVLAQPDCKRPVVTTVALQHLTPALVVNMLRPMFASPGRGDVDASATEGQSVMLRGWQHQVAAALRFIRENDKAPAGGLMVGGPVPAAAPAPAPDPGVAARIAALEKQIEELKREVARLQQPTGK